MSRVAIIGTGFIGRAWTISFARAGHDIDLWDAEAGAPEKALAYIEALLPDLELSDLLDGADAHSLRRRMRAVASLNSALQDCDYVQENTPEDVEVKRQIFAELDRLAPPRALLASSTSAILPSQFTENLGGRGRCFVAHPLNPPYLIPAVEIVPSAWSTAETIHRAATFLRSAGHAPMVMKREIDGFIMNRMQGALLEEAFRLVADGYATVEDIDIGLRDGLALRWCFMGPFETIDLNAPAGVRDYVARYQSIYVRLFPSMQRRVDWSGPVLEVIERARRAKLSADKLEDRQVWRDRHLMALIAHKRRAARDLGS